MEKLLPPLLAEEDEVEAVKGEERMFCDRLRETSSRLNALSGKAKLPSPSDPDRVSVWRPSHR